MPIEGVQTAHDVGSVAGSAAKNIWISAWANVHQNVHQRIKKDRLGYVRIGSDYEAKTLITNDLHADSDPRLHR